MEVKKNKKFQNNGNAQAQDFLAGGGELGELIRTKDWSNTSLGPIENWPKSLRTIVGIMLTSQQPIWIGWGPELIKLYNDPYKSIVGGKHPKALGQPASVVWSDIWKDIEPLLNQVMEKKQGTYSESQLLIMVRNGYPEETYYTFSYSPVPGDTGGVGGMICANTDDTQRVIGERQLASLRTLAAQTADAKTMEDACTMSAAALLANTKDIPFGILYRVDHTNKAASLAGTIGIDKKHPAVPQTIVLGSSSVWPVAEVIKTREVCTVADLGKYFDDLPKGAWDIPPHQAVAVPIMQSGHVAGILVVGLNPYRLFDSNYQRYLTLVSGQIASSMANAQAYEEERKRAEALAEIDRAKTIFFSNVSHEFRTPLTLMLGPLQDMLTETLDADQREHLKVVQRNGLRLQKLVNTLLDFSRLEAGRIQANYTPMDLAAFTAELASNFRSAIEKAGMQLIVNTPHLSEDVYVDRDMWEKIVLNLLSNAFKFTFKGEIEIALIENENSVTLLVRDTGEGIPIQDLTHIFERFKRVEGAKSRTFEGSGIGLSLVQELVKLHGGKIDVESTVGKGTAFQITIPKGIQHLPKDRIHSPPGQQSTAIGVQAYMEELEQWLPAEKETEQNPDDTRPLPGFTDKPRIVLADDNADMRNYIRQLLASRFNIITTSNGREALEEIQKEVPDLLLTDVMMPEMDGFALMEALKANRQTAIVPVIMLSARAGEEAKVEGIEAGADDYLVKPFGANELIARVSALIAANRSRRESENRLYEFFMKAPTVFAVLRGPTHVFELCNPLYMQLIGKERDIIGKSIYEALPEVKDQGFVELMDHVYQTGVPYLGNEIPIKLDRHGNGILEEVYLNFVYYPYKDLKGRIQGIFVQGVDITEQVQSRKEAQESERVLQTLISNLPGMVYRCQEKAPWPLEYASEGVYELSGFQPEDFTSRKIMWADLIHPDDAAEAGKLLVAGLEKKEIFTLVYRIKTMAGKEKWVWDRGQGVYNEKGELLSIEGFVTDITERIKAEGALRKSELRFKTYAEALPQMAFMADARGNIIYYNQRWYDYVGEMTDTEGWGWKDKPIHHPDDLQRTIDKWTTSLQTGEPYEIEYRLRRHDGEYRWHLGRAIPVRDSKGKIEMWLGTNTDIHEHKQAEEALRKSEEFNRTLLESSPDCIKALDLQGALLSMNHQGQVMMEIDDFDAMVGIAWTGLWDGEYSEVAKAAFEKALKGGTGHFQGFRPTIKGTPKWWDVLVAPVYGTDRKVERLVSVSRDITQLKELETQKDDFIGIASHELKTPVTSIKGFIQIIDRLYQDQSYERIGNFLQKAALQVDKITGLINDLLDVSKIQAGKLQYNFSAFTAREIIEDCVEQVTHQDDKHKINVRGDLSVPVYGDKVRLEQVVSNLLTNAIKYSPEADEVVLAVSKENGSLKVAVTDFGIGIPEEKLSHIFDRFFRVEKTSHQFQGLGLGLYICAEIIQRHGGRLNLESTEGKGSTFCFTLPLKGRSLPQAE